MLNLLIMDVYIASNPARSFNHLNCLKSEGRAHILSCP